MIPTSLNASALRDSEGNVIGAIGVLRDDRTFVDEIAQRHHVAQRLELGERHRQIMLAGGLLNFVREQALAAAS